MQSCFKDGFLIADSSAQLKSQAAKIMISRSRESAQAWYCSRRQSNGD
jgi:hypothetical protein